MYLRLFALPGTLHSGHQTDNGAGEMQPGKRERKFFAVARLRFVRFFIPVPHGRVCISIETIKTTINANE
jgi:hypothetical protein